ncbi:primosome [Listeria phage LIS04]|nr:primosome [Listeria phage LIS04]
MINTVVLVGRLTKDPKYQHFKKNDTHRCKFTLAVPRGWYSDEADFIPVVVWKKLALKCRDNLAKGSLVTVKGKMRSRSFQDSNKSKVFIVELEAEDVVYSGKKSSNTSSPESFDNLDLDKFKFMTGDFSEDFDGSDVDE